MAEYPGSFASHTREELIDNTRRVLWPAVKKGLLEPLGAAPARAVAPATDVVSRGCRPQAAGPGSQGRVDGEGVKEV
jgi:hypothetical protein